MSSEIITKNDLKAILDGIGVVMFPADYVIQQGTISGWKYKKWHSGMIEAWHIESFQTSTATAWGNVYYHDDDITIPSGIFTSAPQITATAANSDSVKSQWWVGGLSDITSTGFTIRRMKVNANTQLGDVHIYAVQV